MSAAIPSRALVTGAAGQLGRALCAAAPAGLDCRGLARADADITDAAALARLLDELAPQLLINAAAYTAVDRAESEPQLAQAANATAPALLARACAARGIRLLHVSTDFVFDGRRSTPYPPHAGPAPLGVYGQSKLAGERAVLAALPGALVLRAGWLYSHRGANFLLTMLRLHRERDVLRVVDDQVGTPTRAASLAGALWAAAVRPAVTGIHHWSDAGVCSWYDFAVAIGEEAAALGLIPRAARVEPIASADYPTAARRPAYSVLDKRATRAALELPARHWRSELRAALRDLEELENG